MNTWGIWRQFSVTSAYKSDCPFLETKSHPFLDSFLLILIMLDSSDISSLSAVISAFCVMLSQVSPAFLILTCQPTFSVSVVLIRVQRDFTDGINQDERCLNQQAWFHHYPNMFRIIYGTKIRCLNFHLTMA